MSLFQSILIREVPLYTTTTLSLYIQLGLYIAVYNYNDNVSSGNVSSGNVSSGNVSSGNVSSSYNV